MVWLCKSKISWKGKIALYGYQQFHFIYNSRWYLQNIAEDVETTFDTSNYELDRPFPKGKNEKVIGLIRDELSGKIIAKFIGLRAKTYIFLTDDGSKDKKAKDSRKCVVKRNLNSKTIKSI